MKENFKKPYMTLIRKCIKIEHRKKASKKEPSCSLKRVEHILNAH